MMIDTPIRSLAVVEPDAAAWDAFVAQHPHGHLLQSAGWGALKAQFGWTARRLALATPEGLLAGAQVLLRRQFGLAFAYVPRGPLFAGDQATDELLLQALDRLARGARALFLRLEPNVREDAAEADSLHSRLLLWGAEVAEPLQPRSSVQLELGPPPEHLLKAMSKGHRADIKRAVREGVTVRVGTSQADLDVFYAIMQATSARAVFGIHSKAYYAAVRDFFGDAARLLIAEHGGAPVATALVAAWAGTGLYLYSGSTAEGLKNGAQHAVQWQALQWVRERDCARYDFWGIPDALGRAASTTDPDERDRLERAARADELFGVYRFKKGFGGQIVRFLPAYDKPYLPMLYRVARRQMGHA